MHPSSASCIHNPPSTPFLRGEELPFEAIELIDQVPKFGTAEQTKTLSTKRQLQSTTTRPTKCAIPKLFINKSLTQKTDAKVHKTVVWVFTNREARILYPNNVQINLIIYPSQYCSLRSSENV